MSEPTPEKERILISNSKYDMLNRIHGLHQNVFHMVIAAQRVKNGFVLEGTDEDFNHLKSDMFDELELAPKSRIKMIWSLIHQLTPDDDEF